MLRDSVRRFVTDAQAVLDELQSRVELARVVVRSVIRVDMVVGSHLTRVFATSRNVLRLAEAGEHFDAATLARSVLEHAINLTYLSVQSDVFKSCNDFAVAGLKHVAERHAALAEHYPEGFRRDFAMEEAIRAYADDVDYSAKFTSQVAALQGLGSNAPKFLLDFPYGDFSVFAHPRSKGLDTLCPPHAEAYKANFEPHFDICGAAAFVSVVSVALCVAVAGGFWGLDLTDETYKTIEALQERHPLVGVNIHAGDDALPVVPSRQRRAVGQHKRRARSVDRH